MGVCAGKSKHNERANTTSDMPKLYENDVVHLN